jgi:hypothetical protein
MKKYGKNRQQEAGDWHFGCCRSCAHAVLLKRYEIIGYIPGTHQYIADTFFPFRDGNEVDMFDLPHPQAHGL